MKLKYSNLWFSIFSLTVVIAFSFTLFTEDAFSLRDSDRDFDGINDELDKCPYSAENYNKFEDEDGCPDTLVEEKTKYEFPDTDGDGIEDRFDNCVNLPETFNDYLDEDGCPEVLPNVPISSIDSDLDSIPDSIDACPNEKETFNEFKDADGCPDSLSPFSNTPSEIISQENQCLGGKIPVMRFNAQDPVCVFSDTAKKWEDLGIAEIIIPVSEKKIEEEKTIPIQEIEGKSEESPKPIEAPPEEENLPEISSEIILETDKTILGQSFSYPDGSPYITSKIVTIPVGGETGNHIHEYPLFAFVLKGEVTVDYQNEGTKTYVAGDAIMEAINFIHNGKNMGDEPTEILVVTLGEQ